MGLGTLQTEAAAQPIRSSIRTSLLGCRAGAGESKPLAFSLILVFGGCWPAACTWLPDCLGLGILASLNMYDKTCWWSDEGWHTACSTSSGSCWRAPAERTRVWRAARCTARWRAGTTCACWNFSPAPTLPWSHTCCWKMRKARWFCLVSTRCSDSVAPGCPGTTARTHVL